MLPGILLPSTTTDKWEKDFIVLLVSVSNGAGGLAKMALNPTGRGKKEVGT